SISYFQKAAQKEPYNLDYRIMLGTIFTLTKDFGNAEKELNFVIKENPKLPAAWNGLAFVNLATSKIIDADVDLKRALALDPDFEPALVNRIKYYIALNKFSE